MVYFLTVFSLTFTYIAAACIHSRWRCSGTQ